MFVVGWVTKSQKCRARVLCRPSGFITENTDTLNCLVLSYGAPRADSGLKTPEFDDDDAGTAAHNKWYENNVGAFHAVIREYETKSASICELCAETGKLGAAGHWRSTCCLTCSPEGWVANDVVCDHLSIVNDTCADCGQQRLARIEHTNIVLRNVHQSDDCIGEWCTIHNRLEHPMRSFPQHWREDRAIMERICPHGVGHPDPDDSKLRGNDTDTVHGGEGCCTSDAIEL